MNREGGRNTGVRVVLSQSAEISLHLTMSGREQVAKNRTHKEPNTDASSAQLLRKTLAQALLPPSIRVATTGKTVHAE